MTTRATVPYTSQPYSSQINRAMLPSASRGVVIANLQISETVQDSTKVTVERAREVIRDLSNGISFSIVPE